MRRKVAVSLIGGLLISSILSGCVWFNHHDNGLHKGQYKSKAAKKK